MDFEKLYNNSKAKYEEGMYYDIKAFFESYSEEIEEYSIKFSEDEFEILMKNLKMDADEFVNIFFEFIHYEYLGVIHKERKGKREEYYIYTKIDDEDSGVKIRIKVNSEL